MRVRRFWGVEVSRKLTLLGACALIPVAAIIAAIATGTASAAPPVCTSSQTQVWLGDGEGGGTAGSTYYPLELSNVSHATCTLDGYPGVSAWGLNGVQKGPAGTRISGSHSVVTLAAGTTAHAILRITDWGAECTSGTSAFGLKVYPPGQRQARLIDFPLTVCASRGVLSVEPVRAGVGVPGYTAS
jgi:hypothetical protein